MLDGIISGQFLEERHLVGQLRVAVFAPQQRNAAESHFVEPPLLRTGLLILNLWQLEELVDR